MNFEQIRKLNELWEKHLKDDDRIKKLEEAIISLAKAADERFNEIENADRR